MKVVSNTTPLIDLAKGNLLYVLKGLFERVYIPREVYKEAVDAGLAKGYSDAREIENACEAWIVTRAINIDLGVILTQKLEERPEIDRMLRGIHDGEIEVNMNEKVYKCSCGGSLKNYQIGWVCESSLCSLKFRLRRNFVYNDNVKWTAHQHYKKEVLCMWTSEELMEKLEENFDNYMDLKFFLEDLFNRKVDLVVIEALKPDLKQYILGSVKYAARV